MVTLPGVLAGRTAELERIFADVLPKEAVIYSDHRTTANLVFFRDHQLKPASSTSMAFEDIAEESMREGAYVLLVPAMMEFLTRSYGYRVPRFVEAPPPSWQAVARVGTAILFRIDHSG